MKRILSLTLCLIMILCATMMLSSCDAVKEKFDGALDGVTDKLEGLGEKVPFIGNLLDKINPDDEFVITATAGENGTITPAGEVVVVEGGSQEFTITANEGYEIEDVKVDGTSVGAVATYTFTEVKANATIEATFKAVVVVPKTYTVTATAGENGTITPSGEVTVEEGKSQAFTITPNEGYQIADVKVDGVSVGAVATYTLSNVKANATITVTFDVVPPTHVCAPTVVAKVEATCTAEGKEAYYLCTCGKAYEDAEATKPIADIATWGVIEKIAHDFADATCTDPKTCKVCSATEGEANGHAPKAEWVTDETDHWHECENCDELLNKGNHKDENLDNKCDDCGIETGEDHTLPPQPLT